MTASPALSQLETGTSIALNGEEICGQKFLRDFAAACRKMSPLVEFTTRAIIGTERSKGFAALMRQEGFQRFEEALEEFRDRSDDKFLRA